LFSVLPTPGVGVVLTCATLWLATTQPAAAQEPSYRRLLSLPVATDTIGYPRSVHADLHTGEVFVCDARLNRILIFDDEGLYVYEIPGGDVFTSPRDVAVDPSGFLVVAVNHHGRPAMLELDFDGLFLGEVALSGLPPDAPPPRIASVALSPTGDRLYALDEAALRLWIADRDGVVQSSVELAAGLSEKERRDIILGHVDVYGETVIVAVARHSEIRTFDLDGGSERRIGVRGTAPCTIAFPTAAALADDGEMVIVDKQRMVLVRWDPRNNRCLGDYLGFGSAPGMLYYPMDLALDRSGRVFIGQGFQGRVQMYDGMKPASAPPPVGAPQPSQ